MRKTQENVLIDRNLLSNLIQETSYLIAQARIWGKAESECRMVSGLLAQVAVAMNGKPFSDDGKAGLECPICHKTVDDADYWDGDRCLKCWLEGVGRPDLANILSKPERKTMELFVFGCTEAGVQGTLHSFPVPDAHLESDYDARMEIPDSEMP